MDDEMMAAASDKLFRKLTIDAQDSGAVLLANDALEDAESTLLLYLGRDAITAPMLSTVVALAALYVQRDAAAATTGAVKSSSYSEDKVSQSESYLSPEEFADAEQKILNNLAQYREVRVK